MTTANSSSFPQFSTDEEKAHIVKIMDGSTPILSLKNMVLADALLREIERRLAVHGATSQ